jgi:hypothetical protein
MRGSYSLSLSVRPYVRTHAWNNSKTFFWIFLKYEPIIEFYEMSSGYFSLYLEQRILTNVLHENQRVLLRVSHYILIAVKNVKTQVLDNNKTHFMFSIICYRS